MDGEIDILSYAGLGTANSSLNLPSWVTDWNWTVETDTDILGTGSGGSGYHAGISRDIPHKIHVSEDRRCLSISCVFADEICWKSVPFSKGFPNMVAELRILGFLRSIWQEQVQHLGQNYVSGGPITEAFWRTLIANIGERRQPVTDEYFVRFLSYWRLSRLRDFEAVKFIHDGGIQPSYDDIDARRRAVKKESESNFYNQDQVDALKRLIKDSLSEAGINCTCTVLADESDGIGFVHPEQCDHCELAAETPWEAVAGAPWPLRLDDPTLDMLDGPFIAEWFYRLRDDIRDPIGILRSSANVFATAIARGISNRSFFVTPGKLIGIGPPQLGVQDRIVIIAGAQMPFVVRSITDQNGLQGQYTIIGEAYVHGVMDGSSVPLDDDGDPIWDTITLV